MGYKLIRIGQPWVRVLWPHDHVHDKSLHALMSTIARAPGVTLAANHLELPSSTWAMQSVQELWRRIGVAKPDMPQFPAGVPTDSVSTAQLRDYQWDGVAQALSTTGLLLAFDMGLGKSRTAIAAAAATRARFPERPALIVSTLSSRDVWRQELAALNVPGRFHALSSRDITKGWDPTADWYFVHFDIALAWMTKLQGRKPCVAIVDEAHWIKNGRTQRGRGTSAVVSPVPRRILLTGTPIDNRPSDLWHLLTIVTGPGTWGSPVDFRVRYCSATHNGHGYTDGEPSHVDELQERMAPFYLRRTVDEVALSLPELQRVLQVCPIKDSLRHEHDATLNAAGMQQLARALQQGALRDDALATLTRLRQVTSAAKFDMTCEYVENAQAQGEGVVVFTWERDTAVRIAQRVGGYCITGDVDQNRREEIIRKFQAAPGSVLVATLGALRESVTLHTARLVVMHDWHWVLNHMLQAEARVWRGGQRRACQSVWMMAENSIDTILARVLYAKAQAMGVVGIDKGLEALEELGVGQLARDDNAERIATMLQGWA